MARVYGRTRLLDCIANLAERLQEEPTEPELGQGIRGVYVVAREMGTVEEWTEARSLRAAYTRANGSH